MSNPESRYALVSRRAFMKRSLLTGAAVAIVPALGACAASDEKVLAGKDTPTVPGSTTSPATTAKPAATTAKPAAAASPPANAVPSAAKLTVDFTFAAAAGGRVQNPFIAVWIENEAGALVDTVSLWYEAGKGNKYLPDLTRWYSAERTYLNGGGADVLATVSSASRVAGTYSVVWDATDGKAVPVAQGNYFVCVEAAREHGPYELIRQAISLGTKAFTTTLTPNGELTAAAVKYVA